jgi:hypothetical protein
MRDLPDKLVSPSITRTKEPSIQHHTDSSQPSIAYWLQRQKYLTKNRSFADHFPLLWDLMSYSLGRRSTMCQEREGSTLPGKNGMKKGAVQSSRGMMTHDMAPTSL